MWWKKDYINRRDWMLENLPMLDINASEFVLLQVIDYYNTHHRELSMEQLVAQSGLDANDVNMAIASLNKKGYLALRAVSHQVEFNIDGVFKDNDHQVQVNQDIFNIFENEFGRLLSQEDLSTLSRWTQDYTEEMIIHALKEALIAQKLSMKYINGILVNKAREATW